MSEIDTTTPKDKLVADLRVVVADAEELLKMTAGEVSQSTASLRAKLGGRLRDARQGLTSAQAAAADRARAAGTVADDYVHEHPWQSVAVGAAIGATVAVVLGILASRR